jgi:hypothetical protein
MLATVATHTPRNSRIGAGIGGNSFAAGRSVRGCAAAEAAVFPHPAIGTAAAAHANIDHDAHRRTNDVVCMSRMILIED